MIFKININGIVQGVGFRPFIYRLAQENGLSGEIYNTTEGVEIFIDADKRNIVDDFIDLLKKNRPSPSLIEDISIEKLKEGKDYKDFKITSSHDTGKGFQLVSPDIATCDKCLSDIKNNSDTRRFSYAFTNCTNCGPRFTIIKSLPYDRTNTTMSEFVQCPECISEYEDIYDRRFHAQPNACSTCGPVLNILDNKGKLIDQDDPIDYAAQKLLDGKIVAIKGLGGFQIACDALNDDALRSLRDRKKRPFKPFAVMFKDIEKVEKYVDISNAEKEELCSSRAPIVLIRKRKDKNLSPYVSFSSKCEGCFLPYTPLHHLLLEKVDKPLVMTSGNISEEPIASGNTEALNRLSGICDYFLTHNRKIYSKYDDSVVKIFRDKVMVLRRARGIAPYPVKLKEESPATILATGAQEKNTFCILKGKYAIISQHIGELDDMDAYEFYRSTIKKYLKLFNINKIDVIAYDKHPGYISSSFAKSFNPVDIKIPVQHHEAHLASVLAENHLGGEIIGFLWDGTGYGHDGSIWGSEVFSIDKDNNIKRRSCLKPIALPGGETTIKKPYRMALTYLYQLYGKKAPKDFRDTVFKDFPHYKEVISTKELDILISQLDSGYNTVNTTSMGRLFDAISSILGITHINTYEGQAAIDLEMAADAKNDELYEINIKRNTEGLLILDSIALFGKVIKDLKESVPTATIASRFHNSLCQMVTYISDRLRAETGFNRVALSGGVFQNDLLLSKLYDRLLHDGFEVYINEKVPVNDGGISLGQAYIAMDRIKKGEY